jgi:Rieske Fe-S protein
MTDQPAAAASTAAPMTTPSPAERRGALAAIAAIISGAIVTLTPLLAGGVFSLDPVNRKRGRFRGADADGYLEVTDLSNLPDDGTPVRFPIKADIIDAWNLFKHQTLGTIYLRRVSAATPPVIAFNDTCPHLGCKVNYKASAHEFFCPCHASTFELDGTKINSTPPRNLDALDVKVDAKGKVWVKYQDFKGGIEEKKAIG